MSHFVTPFGTPLKYVTHLGPHPIFSSTTALYKVSLNGSWGFCSGVLFEVICLEGFVGGVFFHSPSVRIPPLQQKVNRHFQFHVSYV